jgi:hypothetical protein
MRSPEEIALAILELNVRELARLNELLGRNGLGGIGVREPRRPKPESPGDAIAAELEES